MDETTLVTKFWSTIHELADSKKAMVTLAGILSSGFTMLGGLVLARYGKEWNLPDSVVAQLPEYAAGLSVMIVGAAVNYVHGQAKVDIEEVKAESTRDLTDRSKDLGKEIVTAVVQAPPSNPNV